MIAQAMFCSGHSRDMLASASGSYGSLAWGYDGVGNRLSEGAANYTYPPISNRLTSISVPAARTFLYDAMGNIKSDQRATGLYTYTYDASGRMASVKKDGTSQATYLYNWQGQQVYRRFKNPSSFVKYHSLHDLSGNRIAEYNATSSGAPTLLREYLWLGGQPVAVIEGGVIHSVRADNINRPVFATNPAGTKTWTVSWLPFGGIHASTGSPVSLRFPGQWYEAESLLHQNWMRDYDPTTGRYLQADPLGLVDGASVYGYAGQSPLRFVDPTGTDMSFSRSDFYSYLLANGSQDLFGAAQRVANPYDVRTRAAAVGYFVETYNDMRFANWLDSDKYFHCKANCLAAQLDFCKPNEAGSDTAELLSDLRELGGALKGDPPVDRASDQMANRAGRFGARNSPLTSCAAICSPFRPSSLPVDY